MLRHACSGPWSPGLRSDSYCPLLQFPPIPNRKTTPGSVCQALRRALQGTSETHSYLLPCREGGREGNGTPLQYSCLENPRDGGAWWAAVHGVAKSWTRLSDFPFTFHFHALEKEMATYSSILAWKIPGTEEPGGLQSMGLQGVGHD